MVVQPKSAVALGMALILAGLLTATNKVVATVTEYLPSVSAGFQGWPSVQAVFMWTTLLVMLGVRFWLWARARGDAGAPWILASAILGVVALFGLTVVPLVLLSQVLMQVGGELLMAVFSAVQIGTMLCEAGALLLFGVGLVRWSQAPRWIGWTALAAGILAVVAAAMLTAQLPGSAVASEPFGWLEAVSLLGLGVTLVLRSSLAEAYTRRVLAAAAAVLVLFVVVAGLAGYAGVRLNAQMRAEQDRSQAFPRAFARLFPGFRDARGSSGVPDGGDGDAAPQGTVSQFDLIRKGNAVMPVLYGNRKDLVSPGGPIHGNAIAFVVPDQGLWYLGDNYFVDDASSEYADVPRDRKLALWDAFAASRREKVRVLGVFPIERLQDRNLLGADGYWPEDLDGATIIVYVSEQESAIAEELRWSTVDELITNGRAYERSAGASSEATASATGSALGVAAYQWSAGAWKPVTTRPSFGGAPYAR